jgi:CubicO group peptidase (beta-lactamase class C family)
MRTLAWLSLVCAALVVSLRAAPQNPGVPIPQALEDAGRAGLQMPRLHSLLVSWRGNLLLERYYNGMRGTRLANIKSASKSVISALVGIAIDRGHLSSVAQPIGPFFPELPPTDETRRAITIEDLLTMRSGLETTSNRNYGSWVQSRNWVRYVLSRDLIAPPGTWMEYSTGSTHLLSAILTRVTKKTTWQFAQESLARPLGFTLAQWPRDPQGIYFGGNDMLMTPRQMLAFGELYRTGGVANGTPVVPRAWIEASFEKRTSSHRNDQGYGYGWWSRPFAGYDTTFAWGYGGQYIFIVPALDLTVVTTSSTAPGEERRENRREIFDVLEEQIIPAIARLQEESVSDSD